MSRPRWSEFVAGALACLCLLAHPAHGGGNRVSAVGGISIDANGVVRAPSADMKNARLKALREEIARPVGPVTAPVERRMISLRGLQEAIKQALQTGNALPDEIQFLAGLQRVEYVFVYPETQDLVIAGPAEGWTVDDRGEIVGVTTGRPVVRLEDLLVALRSVRAARETGISCSIDPTPEGRQRLQSLLDSQRRSPQLNPQVLEPQMKQAFGPQQVTLTGVPADSHFARILVAADYQMKRLAMNLDAAPVRMPSYVDMIKGGASDASNPRWWMATDYEPLAASEDKLAWQLKGRGVKAMTEDEFVQADGTVRGAGKTSSAAQKWADMFTANYDELSLHNAVFAKLRNLMDLCVIAALIEHHDLRGLASCELPLLYDPQSELTLTKWPTPKTVDPECSFLRTRKGWVVTASGGVQVESWQAATRSAADQSIAAVRTKSVAAGANWWWN